MPDDEVVEKRQYKRYEYFTKGAQDSVIGTGVVITSFEEPNAQLVEQARQAWLQASGAPFTMRFTHVQVTDLVELPEPTDQPSTPLLFVPQNGKAHG